MKVAVYDTKPYDRKYLQSKNEEIEYLFFETRLSAETTSCAKDCDAAVLFVNDVADRKNLTALSEHGVKMIAMRCAGYNNVDLDAAKELGLRVVRVPAYSPHAVAEHTVALLQTLNRKIHRAHNRVREHNFSLGGLVGRDLHGKTVGIIGAGKIGRCTAQIFRGYGCHVLVADPEVDQTWAEKHGIKTTSLHKLIPQSDIVSLHLPLTPQTSHLIGEEELATMKNDAFLLNTSRGKLIDTSALIKTLKKGHLAGVALDVYEEEEGIFFEDLSDRILDDDDLTRLLTFPQVLVTSHQAFLTEEALSQIARSTSQNLIRFQRNEDPLDSTILV